MRMGTIERLARAAVVALGPLGSSARMAKNGKLVLSGVHTTLDPEAIVRAVLTELREVDDGMAAAMQSEMPGQEWASTIDHILAEPTG
jgi:DUF917 family protein